MGGNSIGSGSATRNIYKMIIYCHIMLKSHNKYAGISKIAGRDETKHRTGTTKMPRFTVLNFTGEIKVKNRYDSNIKRTQFRNDQSKR